MTAREALLALYELNGGSYCNMVADLMTKHHYSKPTLEEAVAKFNKEHEGDKVVVLTDPDYPQEMKSRSYKNPPLVIINGKFSTNC
jgi:predicted Rossmann fold nucleotide-binding protein DprA/Smf involved in DNA uptake